MAELIEREIDGEIYNISRMRPFEAHNVLMRIAVIVAPALAANTKSASIMDADLNSVVKAFCSSFDASESEAIMKAMLKNVIHKGHGQLTEAVVNAHYVGKLPHLYKVVYAAMEVEFGGFFGESGALSGLLKMAPPLAKQT